MTSQDIAPLKVVAELEEVLRQTVVKPRVAPHATAGYAQLQGGCWYLYGATSEGDCGQPYDLASISKPFTALVCSMLVAQQQLTWTTPLGDVLPELRATWGGKKTIEQLLSHRSGLAAHRELYARALSGASIHRAEMIQLAAETKARNVPNEEREHAPLYSDLGYILVGRAIERITGEALDVVVQKMIGAPWSIAVGSARTFLASDLGFSSRAVPTEIQARRGGLIRGMVHDDNAWALSGLGTSGHAGLFGSLEALLRFGAHLLDEKHSSLIAPLIKERPGGSLLMGFDGKSAGASSAGSRASSRTFGHLGFTGTSLWCDPVQQRVSVLLTNRVFYGPRNKKIAPLRSFIHDFLWTC